MRSLNAAFRQFVPLLLIAAVALFCAGADARFPGWLREALRPYDTATVRLSSFSDAQYQTGVMLVVYILQYCALGGLFEGTHPDGALSGSLSPLRSCLPHERPEDLPAPQPLASGDSATGGSC